MFDKCIPCNRMGESCVPNLMLLPFPDLIKWCDKRQKYLGWTSQMLAAKSKVPVSTISRIKAGDYADCKYSTMRSILLALIGGTKDEFACTEQVAQLEQQAAKMTAVEEENKALKERLAHLDELYHQEVHAIKAEYHEEIAFLRDELKARRGK